MLESIIDFINLKLGLLNYFEKTHCLSTLVKNDDGLIYPAEYISNGDFDAVDFDAYDGVSYIRVNGEIDVERVDQRYTPKPRLNVTFPLRLVYAVRKDKLTKDDAYSFDRVRGSLVKQLESDSADLENQLEADRIVVSTSNYISDTKELWDEETAETGTFQPKYEVVFGAMEVSVTVTTRAECIPSECDDFESDILRTFDFCKQSVIDRFTPTQISCLESEFGTSIQTQVNGVDTEVATSSPYNQQIHDSAGSDVGTASNPSIVSDSTITINSSSLGATGDVVAEGSLDITVNLDGSPSGSWSGTSWDVVSSNPNRVPFVATYTSAAASRYYTDSKGNFISQTGGNQKAWMDLESGEVTMEFLSSGIMKRLSVNCYVGFATNPSGFSDFTGIRYRNVVIIEAYENGVSVGTIDNPSLYSEAVFSVVRGSDNLFRFYRDTTLLHTSSFSTSADLHPTVNTSNPDKPIIGVHLTTTP